MKIGDTIIIPHDHDMEGTIIGIDKVKDIYHIRDKAGSHRWISGNAIRKKNKHLFDAYERAMKGI